MTKILNLDADLTEVCAALKNGAVIIIPTETVYGFVCDPAREDAVERIYALKNRSLAVPMQLLLARAEAARDLSDFSEEEAALARAAWPGEMTLIVKPNVAGQKYARGFETLGLRVPRHPFTRRLLEEFGGILAATSANLHGRTPISAEKEIVETFSQKADCIFRGGDIKGEASTVVRLHPLQILRQGKLTKEQIICIIKK